MHGDEGAVNFLEAIDQILRREPAETTGKVLSISGPVFDSATRIMNGKHVQGYDTGPSSRPVADNSWEDVRVIDDYSEEEKTELQRLFKETAAPLPCVEYWSKEPLDYHGYLMDEERIIGLRVSALMTSFEFDPDVTLQYEEHGTISSFDVHTL